MLPHEAMERTPHRWYLIYKRYIDMESGVKPHQASLKKKIEDSKAQWGSLMKAARDRNGSKRN